MDELIIYLYESISKTFITLRNIKYLYFDKERYTPYTTARFRAVCDKIFDDTCEVQIAINAKVIHQGTADTVRAVRTDDGLYDITVTSKGFTAALCSNQPIPGINSSPDLKTLIENNISNTRISCETDTEVVNYVYVLDKDSVWDAIAAYSIKGYSSYPFIRSSNTVRVTIPEDADSFEYSDEIVEAITGSDLSTVISQINMKDYNDSYYTYSLTNEYAALRGITKQKTIDLDSQWLATPEVALTSRVGYLNKAARYKAVKLEGYNGEDLFDSFTATIDDSEFIASRRIHRITVAANAKGIFTTVYTYFDTYSGDIELTTE